MKNGVKLLNMLQCCKYSCSTLKILKKKNRKRKSTGKDQSRKIQCSRIFYRQWTNGPKGMHFSGDNPLKGLLLDSCTIFFMTSISRCPHKKLKSKILAYSIFIVSESCTLCKLQMLCWLLSSKETKSCTTCQQTVRSFIYKGLCVNLTIGTRLMIWTSALSCCHWSLQSIQHNINLIW